MGSDIRVVGIDSGSSHFAHCVIDVARAPKAICERVDDITVSETTASILSRGNKGVRCVRTGIYNVDGTRCIDVGHRVPLARPRKHRDGKIIKEEHIVDANDIEQHYSMMRGFLEVARVGHPTCIAAFERSLKVYPKGSSGISVRLATDLRDAEGLCMVTYAIAKSLGYHCVFYTPEEVRRAIAGSPKAENKDIAAAIPLCISNWPTGHNSSNNHERDAAATAVHAGRRWFQ